MIKRDCHFQFQKRCKFTVFSLADYADCTDFFIILPHFHSINDSLKRAADFAESNICEADLSALC